MLNHTMEKAIPSGGQRCSNIELLRIISMIMIICSHFGVHGGFAFDHQSITITHLWVRFLELSGTTSVNIFVLISGYF